jgi:hypothetical protein
MGEYVVPIGFGAVGYGSFTGTTKRTRVPATLRIKEIALILQQLPRKDQLNLPFISITAVNGLLS